MYNIYIDAARDETAGILEKFGEKYDLTDDPAQANVFAYSDRRMAEIPGSRLLFAVCGMSAKAITDAEMKFCLERGICVFDDAECTRDFIENGNIAGSSVFPDISFGPFGDDVSRVLIMMKGIDDPILYAAMMFSGMDVRAISGGLSSGMDVRAVSGGLSSGMDVRAISDKTAQIPADNPATSSDDNGTGDADDMDMYGAALVALREPVTRIRHLDGVLKVRVLQDI